MSLFYKLYFAMAKCFAMQSLLVLIVICPAQAQIYQVTHLGTLNGDDSLVLAHDLNAGGQAVGAALGTPTFRSYLWSQGSGMVNIGSLSGGEEFSWANAVNDVGQVTGQSQTAPDGPVHAYLWSPNSPNGTIGSMVDLGALPGGNDSSSANAINSYGQVVGSSNVADNSHAFLWTPNAANSSAGSMVDLGRLGDAGYSSASDVNGAGVVVGSSYNDNDGEQAFMWVPNSPNGTTGAMSALDILPLASGAAAANGINELGQIVGYGPQELSNERIAYLWTTPTTPQELGVLPGDLTSSAADINNMGQIVGTSDGAISRAFVWMEGVGMLDLNSLLNASGNGWQLRQALAINDAGQIVGLGTDPDGALRGFLLTPVPEPASMVMAMVSAVGFWMLRRRLARRHR